MLNLLSSRNISIAAIIGFSFCTSVFSQQQNGNDKDPGWHPTPADKVKLPQYCWSQYDSGAAKKTGIQPPTAICGVYTNHLCPGLVLLNRAKDLNRPMAMRKEYAKGALNELQYNAKWMKPDCKLKLESDAAHLQAQNLVRLLR